MKRLQWIIAIIALLTLIVVGQWALAQGLAPHTAIGQVAVVEEPARVLLLGGHFDSKLERMNLVLDVNTPGTYRLVIERRGKITRLAIEDVKTGKIEWVGKLEKEE